MANYPDNIDGKYKDLDKAASELEKLRPVIDKEKDKEKRGILKLILSLSIMSAKLAKMHFEASDGLGTLTDVVKSLIGELRWVFYIALIALFRNEFITIVVGLGSGLVSYIKYGISLYGVISPDQKFNFWYILPLSALFGLIMFFLGRKAKKNK